MFCALDYSIPGRAQEKKLLEINYWNPRNYTDDKHKRVDDRPYGGGPGMVMMAQPLHDCINAAKQSNKQAMVIYLTPQGKLLDQNGVCYLAKQQNLILIAGRYGGIDERIIKQDVDKEWSIGDYVISGGELAAMVVIDSIIRLKQGVLGDMQSAQQDSFMCDLLACPHYTRPELFNGQSVPKVLLSGTHRDITRWRLKQALGRTYSRRPNLFKKRKLNDDEQKLLDEFIRDKRD